MIEIKRIGLYAQLVDQGRRLSSHLGLTASGAMDWQSYEFGHALIGNELNGKVLTGNVLTGDDLGQKTSAASIEVTMGDIELAFHKNTVISITGALATCMVDGAVCTMNRPLFLQKGSVLSISNIGKEHGGMRLYISIKGSLKAPLVCDSVANVKRENSGGLHGDGSALKKGDMLEIAPYSKAFDADNIAQIANALHKHFFEFEGAWKSSLNPLIKAPIQVIPAYQWDDFELAERSKLCSAEFSVTPDSDRMGMRLKGKTIYTDKRKLYSQGLCNGAIQCAGDGQLIIMLNDRQTIGGYPVIGAVEAFSRAKLGQTSVGDTLVFSITNELEAASRISMWRGQIKNIALWVDQALAS